MNPLVYGAYKFEFEVVCDITDRVSESLTDSNTNIIPRYELQRNNNKMLLLTIQHYIEEIKQWIDDI